MAALCLSAGLLFAVPRLARTRRAITRLIDLILILAGLIGLAAFLDFVIDPSTQWGQPRPFHAGRLSAPFLSANTAATFYGAILIFAGARLLEAMRRDVPASSNSDRFGERARSLLVPVSVLLVCGTDLFLSASRAGISLAMTGLLALLVWDSLSHWRGRPGEKGARQAWVPTVFVGLSGLVFLMSGTLYPQLTAWTERHYRDRLAPNDLADPALLRESREALDALTGILGLGGGYYPFQRG